MIAAKDHLRKDFSLRARNGVPFKAHWRAVGTTACLLSFPQAVKNALHLAETLVQSAATAVAAAGSPPAAAASNSHAHTDSVGVPENDTADMALAAANTAAEGAAAAEGGEGPGDAEAAEEEEGADDPVGDLSAAGLMRRIARLAGDE